MPKQFSNEWLKERLEYAERLAIYGHHQNAFNAIAVDVKLYCQHRDAMFAKTHHARSEKKARASAENGRKYGGRKRKDPIKEKCLTPAKEA